jgi:hydroxyacylglutathione hydrolase
MGINYQKVIFIWALFMVLVTACYASDSKTLSSKQNTNSKDERLIIKVFKYPNFDGNYYLVSKGYSGALIDGGGAAVEIIKYVHEKKLNLKSIILTHGHYDHVIDVMKLKNALKSKIFIHQADAVLFKETCKTDADIYLSNEDILKVGTMDFKIIYTPGHTKGSISLKISNHVFTGDTLFWESIGRTDLEGGSYAEIILSIQNKLMKLDDHTKVFPGHGAETTIGYEKAHNAFLQE